MGRQSVLDPEVMAVTRVPRSLAAPLGIFVVCFCALDAERNKLTAHLAGASALPGDLMAAAVSGYEVQTRLLQDLIIATVESESERDKLLKLAHGFLRVAEYHHALLHHEFLQFVPRGKTVAAHMKNIDAIKMPVEFSMAWLIYNTNFSGNLAARMHQYRTGDRMWTDDRYFPWHEKPLSDPDDVPHLTRAQKRH